jgi:hypothetical protein
MTISNMKTGLEPCPGRLCISNVSQEVDIGKQEVMGKTYYLLFFHYILSIL